MSDVTSPSRPRRFVWERRRTTIPLPGPPGTVAVVATFGGGAVGSATGGDDADGAGAGQNTTWFGAAVSSPIEVRSEGSGPGTPPVRHRLPLVAWRPTTLLAALATGSAAEEPADTPSPTPTPQESAVSDVPPTGSDEPTRPLPAVGSPAALAEALGSLPGPPETGAIGRAFTQVTSAGATVAHPIRHGEYTVIPLSEVIFSGGMGGGTGIEAAAPGSDAASSGGGGGGGGGMGRSRAVAVAVIGPNGVEVKPVFDRTAVALAGIAAGLTLLKLLRRWTR